ncbi:hypothetical protein NDA18_003318 [Ustilago nuda]|nr:hypothetical protein NDA18_003318 [Ustilago nuda]
MSPYHTRSKATADAPTAEAATTTPRCRVVLQLKPQEDLAAEAVPTVPSDSAHEAEPPVAPVIRSPLEPLFLGMDDDTVIPRPLPSPFLALVVPPIGDNHLPLSPAIDLYEVDARRPGVEVTTPERQAAWEAELARSTTPPPTADEVVDAILAASRANTPVFWPEIQPLTPPPRWVSCFASAFTNPFDEWVIDPVNTWGWIMAMRVLWHLRNQQLPHELVTEAGGPPDPINAWVEPTIEERWTRAALAAPPVPSGHVDM